jgi:hypothetical protein
MDSSAVDQAEAHRDQMKKEGTMGVVDLMGRYLTALLRKGKKGTR